jgi:hypothetical protein
MSQDQVEQPFESLYMSQDQAEQPLESLYMSQDQVEQPFESLLPYWRFSVRLSHSDIPRLRQILEAVTDERVSRMQHAIIKYQR